MRGYFGIGVQGISKAQNLGAVMRTAHAFGSSFVFTVSAHHKANLVNETDTSKSFSHLPLYQWDNVDEVRLPVGCTLVGVELCDQSVDLPSFRHPQACAYILGPEKGSLSADMQAKCTHLVKIPTKFCINVSLAAALTLYDRTLCLGGYPERPLMPGGPDLAALEDWKRLKLRKD
ncbi:MAG: TrmH family RNA methyltransferase [Acidimicrobiales bacterium]|nr:RNA methyltransferase [Hyphomonadaceae bacterium]RZV44040.1 MAG: TrmH family RNA methyltransferase [Acidimicrobiales bacterium]